MRRFLTAFTCAAALVAGPALAQADSSDPNYHELPLSIGDSGRILQTARISKTKIEDGKTHSGIVTSQAALDYQWLEEGGYRVTRSGLSVTSTRGDGSTKAAPDEATPLAAAVMGGVKEMQFIADESLYPLRIENWPQFKSNLYLLVDKFLRASGIDEDMAESKKMTDGLFGQLTAESAAPIFLANEAWLSLPRNTGLVLNVPTIAESQVPSPIGGPMLDARERILLTAWNEASGTAHVTYDFGPTPESLQAFLKDFMPRFVGAMNVPAGAEDAVDKEIESRLKASSMEMTTHCEYDVAIATGIVTNATCVKTIAFKFGPQSIDQTERFEFTETLAE